MAPEPDPKMVTLPGSPPNSATLTWSTVTLDRRHLQPPQRLQLVLQAEVARQVGTAREGKEAKRPKAVLDNYKHDLLG